MTKPLGSAMVAWYTWAIQSEAAWGWGDGEGTQMAVFCIPHTGPGGEAGAEPWTLGSPGWTCGGKKSPLLKWLWLCLDWMRKVPAEDRRPGLAVVPAPLLVESCISVGSEQATWPDGLNDDSRFWSPAQDFPPAHSPELCSAQPERLYPAALALSRVQQLWMNMEVSLPLCPQLKKVGQSMAMCAPRQRRSDGLSLEYS